MDPQIFNIDLNNPNPKRVLIWGPVRSCKSGLVGLGSIHVKNQGFQVGNFVARKQVEKQLEEEARNRELSSSVELSRQYSVSHQSRTSLRFSAYVFNDAESAIKLIQEKALQVVFIEEVQFIPDLARFLKLASDAHVHVFMTGLSSTYKGEPWPVVRDILHLCRVVQQFSICDKCKDPMAFMSILNDGWVVGEDDIFADEAQQPGREIFSPVCERCFKAHWNQPVEDTESSVDNKLRQSQA